MRPVPCKRPPPRAPLRALMVPCLPRVVWDWRTGLEAEGAGWGAGTGGVDGDHVFLGEDHAIADGTPRGVEVFVNVVHCGSVGSK